MKLFQIMALAFVTFSTMSSQAGTFFSDLVKTPAGLRSTHPELSRIHSAFLEQDYQRMALEMKEAFLKGHCKDPLVRENIFSLLQKAYALRTAKGIPVDWSLPEEITKMRISVRTIQKEISEYSLKASGNTSGEHMIHQLRITRFPDQVVLDKQEKIGEWEEEPANGDTGPEFQLMGLKSRQPIPGGLYFMYLQLTNGKNVEGWFLLDDNLNSSDTPKVMIPSNGQTFETGNPSFHWNNFVSPQYQPDEHRSVWMAVSASEPPQYIWDPKWTFFEDSPSLEEITVGTDPGGAGIQKLTTGRYIFVINYHERRRFGDLTISRSSITNRPFKVRLK